MTSASCVCMFMAAMEQKVGSCSAPRCPAALLALSIATVVDGDVSGDEVARLGKRDGGGGCNAFGVLRRMLLSSVEQNLRSADKRLSGEL